jgi:probable rRNA maturation factor
MKIRTAVNINEKLWRQDAEISKKIKAVIKKIIPQTSLISLKESVKIIEISILLTSDEQIQELNKNYRGKDKSTNVLSFPMLDGKKIKDGNFFNFDWDFDELLLGDIVISYQRVLEEAKNEGKKFDDHLTHLIIHSILHLIGFDHEEDEDAKKMEKLEIEILANLGIVNPY